MSRAKFIVQRVYTCSHRVVALYNADPCATDRPCWDREQVANFHGLIRMIVEGREAFEVDGEVLQVKRRLPSTAGSRSDVLLVRSYAASCLTRNPYLRAIQVAALERLAAENLVSFPIGLGAQASAPVSDWDAEGLASLDILAARGRE